MIQDIAPHRLINHYDPAIEPEADDRALFVRGSSLLTANGEELDFPRVRDLPAGRLTYLFTVAGESCFLYRDELNGPVPGFAMRDLRDLRGQRPHPKYRMFAAYTAKHIADWYRDTAFCGRCGARTEHSRTERASVCPACGYTAYPRIMPAVIVGVKNGDRLLITRYAGGNGHSALIAGFTEIGETLEQTVEREVMEEAGIRVKKIRYYGSQPWGIANDILAGFYCEVDGDDTITMDPGELKYAQWVPREEIILQPDETSLTNEMMTRFRNGIER